MFQLIRDRWAARAARVRELEGRVGELERGQKMLAANLADLLAHVTSSDGIGQQIHAQLAHRPRVWFGPG
jgi:hypothetical protein